MQRWLFSVFAVLSTSRRVREKLTGDPHIRLHQCKRKDTCKDLGSGGRAVERRTVNRGDGGSIPPTAVSKLRQFPLPHIRLCLSEETLKAGGPFHLVSMPGEVKDPTHNV